METGPEIPPLQEQNGLGLADRPNYQVIQLRGHGVAIVKGKLAWRSEQSACSQLSRQPSLDLYRLA